jgi:hypothetical protein
MIEARISHGQTVVVQAAYYVDPAQLAVLQILTPKCNRCMTKIHRTKRPPINISHRWKLIRIQGDSDHFGLVYVKICPITKTSCLSLDKILESYVVSKYNVDILNMHISRGLQA